MMWTPLPYPKPQSRIDVGDSVWVMVDLQRKLLPAFDDAQVDVLWHSHRVLATVACGLDVPVLLTEHCPDKIGGIDARFADLVPHAPTLTKIAFGAAQEAHLVDAVRKIGRQTVIVSGVESHICVLQTALGLVDVGCRVVALCDAMASVVKIDHNTALTRLENLGVLITTAECVAYEWLGRGDHPLHRSLLAAVKQRRQHFKLG